MSRAIKFRVWDKANRRWLFPDDETPDWSGGSKDAICFWCYKDTGLSVHSISSSTVEITQFTGLLDSKGREIYEGDICVGIRFGERFNQYPFKVEWCELQAGDDADLTSYGFHFNPYFNEYEIIGNIFENPELLRT